MAEVHQDGSITFTDQEVNKMLMIINLFYAIKHLSCVFEGKHSMDTFKPIEHSFLQAQINLTCKGGEGATDDRPEEEPGESTPGVDSGSIPKKEGLVKPGELLRFVRLANVFKSVANLITQDRLDHMEKCLMKECIDGQGGIARKKPSRRLVKVH